VLQPQHVRALGLLVAPLQARKASRWPKNSKLVHTFLRKYSYKRLELAKLLDQLGGFLTCR
jgi:hypothetical protein